MPEHPTQPQTIGFDEQMALEFDFLKHLTSLSVATIGGAVTLGGSIFAKVPDKALLWGATGLVAAGGALAFQGHHLMLGRLAAGRPAGRLGWWARNVAAGLYAIGTGLLIVFAYASLR
jgi:hypothetical protein